MKSYSTARKCLNWDANPSLFECKAHARLPQNHSHMNLYLIPGNDVHIQLKQIMREIILTQPTELSGEGSGTPLQYSCLEKFHGRRSLVGCSPWGRKESDTTERLHFHFSLSCIGEGNGNPLPCSCLENPRNSRAWWATVYLVAQSDRTEMT